jgi:phospholipid/cholesterol/gamma-HCH transport system substrate-binding protein
LGPGDYIPNVIGSSGMEAVLEQAGKLSELYPKLDRIATNVEELTEGLAVSMGGKKGGESLGEIVTNLQETSRELKAISQNARVVTEEAQRLTDDGTLRVIAFNLEATTDSVRTIAQRIGQIVEAGDVDAVVQNLNRTSEELAEIGVDLKELIREGIEPRIGQLDRIFRNVERFSLELAKFGEKNAPPLTETVESVRAFAQKLVGIVDRSEGDIQAAVSSVRTTLDVARESLTKLNETVENVRSISADLRAGRGTVGRLLTDDRLIKEVEEIVTETKDFVKSYSLMQTEVELASSYFVRGKSFKNVFSIRFRPKEDKYYLMQIVDDPRRYTTDTFIVTESNDAEKPPVLKERVETTAHQLKLSFQFAKNFYFLTGRFGIMENTGGLGLDFHFFQDRLNFQFDLFDFTMDTNPRLRGIVEWEIIKHLFLAGGADDLLNDSYRDYFFSIGVRFTDDDLKSLLMAAPSISP